MFTPRTRPPGATSSGSRRTNSAKLPPVFPQPPTAVGSRFRAAAQAEGSGPERRTNEKILASPSLCGIMGCVPLAPNAPRLPHPALPGADVPESDETACRKGEKPAHSPQYPEKVRGRARNLTIRRGGNCTCVALGGPRFRSSHGITARAKPVLTTASLAERDFWRETVLRADAEQGGDLPHPPRFRSVGHVQNPHSGRR